jgi:hypothetical protein
MSNPGQEASMDKLLTLAASALVTAALTVVVTSGHAQGYEASIYKAYPSYFWLFLLLAYVLGLSILIRHAFIEKESKWWLAGLAVVLLSSSILLLLPFFRGYVALGYMDPLYSLGFIKDIELTGHFGAARQAGENFYPALHILVASLDYVTGLKAEQVVQLIPALFFAFYVVSVYLLSREVVKQRGPALLMAALASLPLYTSTGNESFAFPIPRMETFLLLPFVLYLFVKARKGKSIAFAVPLVLLLLALPAFHPGDGGPFIIGVLLTLGLASRLYDGLRRWRMKQNTVVRSELWENVANPVLILCTTWFIWFSAFGMFDVSVRSWGDWLIRGVSRSEASITLDVLSRAQVPIQDIILLTIKRHGHQIAFFLVSAMIAAGVGRTLLSSRGKTDPNLVVLSALFVVTALATVFSFLAGTMVGFTRFIVYGVFAAALLNGYGLYKLLEGRRNKAVAALAMVFLLILVGQGIANVYPSPFVAQANAQVTRADREGMKWLLAYQDEDLFVEQVAFTQLANAVSIGGYKVRPRNLRDWEEVNRTTPDHFGYRENDTFGASYEDDRYFVSHALSRVIYTETIPEYTAGWRWTPDDFARLESDVTVSRLYDSGGFEVFYVEGRKTARFRPI